MYWHSKSLFLHVTFEFWIEVNIYYKWIAGSTFQLKFANINECISFTLKIFFFYILNLYQLNNQCLSPFSQLKVLTLVGTKGEGHFGLFIASLKNQGYLKHLQHLSLVIEFHSSGVTDRGGARGQSAAPPPPRPSTGKFLATNREKWGNEKRLKKWEIFRKMRKNGKKKDEN